MKTNLKPIFDQISNSQLTPEQKIQAAHWVCDAVIEAMTSFRSMFDGIEAKPDDAAPPAEKENAL